MGANKESKEGAPRMSRQEYDRWLESKRRGGLLARGIRAVEEQKSFVSPEQAKWIHEQERRHGIGHEDTQPDVSDVDLLVLFRNPNFHTS